MVPIFLLLLTLSACKKQDDTGKEKEGAFELPSAPVLMDVAYDEAPLYFFLFTHTEDQFNHELSEERYWRGGEIIENLNETYPDIPLSWTIEFQGADAETVAERNDETKVVDYLMTLYEEKLVHFGYHAHHDPTYQNRPQNTLDEDSNFQEIYDAMHTWISCRKDPIEGGCIEDTGGGLMAVLENFGEVSIITGLGVGEGVQFERSAGNAAILDLLPNALVGFAFPDHGATTRIPDYEKNKAALMNLVSPTHETSSYAFWMDNQIRLNDASINTLDGAKEMEESLEAADRSRPQLMNVGYMSKYMYTDEGTSPTTWAYAHPSEPELPENLINSNEEIEKNYSLSKESLEYFMEFLSNDTADSQFVWTNEIIELFTSDDYWKVDDEELYNVALWLLNDWDESTPIWAYDGEDYYSLSDSFFLLAHGLQGTFPDSGIVSAYYGPWSLETANSSASTMEDQDLREWLTELDLDEKQIEPSLKIGEETFTPAQVLYAMAYAYVLDHNQISVDQIQIPAMNNAPETFALIEVLGCISCLDTVWSLKPARFQNLDQTTLIPFTGIDPISVEENKAPFTPSGSKPFKK